MTTKRQRQQQVQTQIPFGNDNKKGNDKACWFAWEVWMEMAMEVKDELGLAVERLTAAAGVLEMAAEKLVGLQVSAASSSTAELEERLRVAEATIASLRGEGAAVVTSGRKTLPAGVVSLLAKGDGRAMDLAGLDGALVGLSMEQRIAVKAQLMRAGLV